MKIFLGGTCNGSTWRDELIPQLSMDYFNPVVSEWTPEAQDRELYEREHSDICLYVLTPRLTGFFSIAEVVDDSNKRPQSTVLCVLLEDENQHFTPHQMKSLQQIGRMVRENGGFYCEGLDALTAHLRERQKVALPTA